MKLPLAPAVHVTAQRLTRGLRLLVYDAICSQTMVTFGSIPFLVAIALSLHASTLVIGLITALGPLSQVVQLPSIYLIERLGHRKLIVVVTCFISRTFWIVLAAVPSLIPAVSRIAVFVGALAGFYLFNGIASLAFSAWMRDLIPEPIRGEFGGHRIAVATTVGAVVAIVVGYAADLYGLHRDRNEILAAFLLVAAAIGYLGCGFLARIPEPRMTTPPVAPLWTIVSAPLADPGYRLLIGFLAVWGFSTNLAAPFFAVYMLQRLHLSLGVVMGLGVLGLIGNVMLLRLWGRLADRFSNKSVLRVACPLLLTATVLWPLSSWLDARWFVLPLLAVIHLATGIAASGISLASGNIATKLAPRGRSTPYFAVIGMITGAAATLAPVLVGLIAGGIEVAAPGASPSSTPASQLDLGLLEVAFIAAAVLGALSLQLLKRVPEAGDTHPAKVNALFRRAVRAGLRRSLRPAAIGAMFSFPYASVARRFPDGVEGQPGRGAELR